MEPTPEQLARDKIDSELTWNGWLIQSKSKINLKVGLGIAVRKYQTDIGPADLFCSLIKNRLESLKPK